MYQDTHQLFVFAYIFGAVLNVFSYYFFIYKNLDPKPNHISLLVLFLFWPFVLFILFLQNGSAFLSKTIALTKILIFHKNFRLNLFSLLAYKDQFSQIINSDSVKNDPNVLSEKRFEIDECLKKIEFHSKKNQTYLEVLDATSFKWVKRKFNSAKMTTDLRGEYFSKINKKEGAISWVFDYKVFKNKSSSAEQVRISTKLADIEEFLLDVPRVLYSAAPGTRFSLGSGAAFRTKSREEVQDWQSIFTNDFKKSVKQMDKNLQGRVFSAILEILESPLTLKGDTLKPLSADLKGAWRYRLGDYRLVYFPNSEGKKVVFLDIASRGGVYH
jgi:mRNA-degrading endonuclease RelE of RelBE toxin-antitoxin system